MSTDRNTSCPRLIEVALPIREISAESVRDKRIDQGNISSLHVWWARRPLAASRAVVFASLVPDPDDPRCPEAFTKAVGRLLRTDVPSVLRYYRCRRETVKDDDPYCPYHGVADTLRNRLLMFIARWSHEHLEFEGGRQANPPRPPEALDYRCLVKWETSDPDSRQGREVLRVAHELLRVANGHQPVVFDPFSGGGAIPLEAGRLGCRSVANDYNPVAYLVLRATCEFPKRYGKAGKRTVSMDEFGRSVEREIDVPNILVHDLDHWAMRLLEHSREKIDHLYPMGRDGLPILTYLWARTVPCSNPSCKATIPLIRSLLLRSNGDQVALTINVDKSRKEISFGIAKGDQIKQTNGTKTQRGPAKCPICEEPTTENDIRRAAINGRMSERLIAVVVEKQGQRDYRPVEEADLGAVESAQAIEVEAPGEYIVPEINGPGASPDAGSHRSINLELYGFARWGQLFTRRQLIALSQFVASFQNGPSSNKPRSAR